MHFVHSRRTIGGIQHMKAAAVIGEINEMISEGDLANVSFLKETEEPGIRRILAREDYGGWADIDADHIKTMAHEKNGVMSGTRSDIERLSDGNRSRRDKFDEIRIRAAGVPRQGLRIVLGIHLFP